MFDNKVGKILISNDGRESSSDIEEALSLGIRPERIRWMVIGAASLAAASAVAVSGLIAFVGIIVPHAVRLVAGASNRVVVPLSLIMGMGPRRRPVRRPLTISS